MLIRTSRVELRPVVDGDLALLYRAAVSAPERWVRTCRSGTPSPARFAELLWAGVVAQFLVVPLEGPPSPAGLVAIHSVDLWSETAWLDVISCGVACEAAPTVLREASILAVEHAFRMLGLRKISTSTAGFATSPLEGLPAARCEGHLRADTYFAGQYWDRRIDAILHHEWRSAGGLALVEIGAVAHDPLDV